MAAVHSKKSDIYSELSVYTLYWSLIIFNVSLILEVYRYFLVSLLLMDKKR